MNDLDRSVGVGGELVDLSNVSLAELRKTVSRSLDESTERVLRQAERPRMNLGGAGPPGRAD
jgi:hypothetical protein